jgi:hypothetical protein
MTDISLKYTEDAVGVDHPTLSDVMNRIFLAQALNGFRLIKSGSNLTLEAVGGNAVEINGRIHQYTTLPTLAASGLSVGTTYFIYLYDNAGSATLEASTTGYTVTNKGRPDKTGDATRRLMGLARVITGPAWADNQGQRLVRSYNHRKSLDLLGAFTSNSTTTSTSYVELQSAARIEFLVWAFEVVAISVSGANKNTASSDDVFTSVGLDGATTLDAFNVVHPAVNSYSPVGLSINTIASEGYHYATILGKVAAGTGNWEGGGTVGVRTTITCRIGASP